MRRFRKVKSARSACACPRCSSATGTIPKRQRAALDDDRWYHTGDFGHVRDEFVYLEGRRQDLIIRGGENIYPAEIENRLIEHPDITEVAVDRRRSPAARSRGEGVRRCARVRLTEDGVREFAGEALAAYKVPTHVEFVDALPHNATGKVLKHLLGKEQPPETAAGFIEE